MPRSTARLETAHAQRYLGQLCKHFAHKAEVEWEEGAATGRCGFRMGSVRLEADEAGLAMTAEAADEAALAQVQDVTWSHLERFAFREAPAAPEWRAA